MSNRIKFTATSNIQEALDLDDGCEIPVVRNAFEKLGLKCWDCVAAEGEDLRVAALYHEKNLDDILQALNELGIKQKD